MRASDACASPESAGAAVIKMINLGLKKISVEFVPGWAEMDAHWVVSGSEG